MPLISKSIPALNGGVSQQPASLRFRTQCETLENGYPSITDGLQQRPPTEHSGNLVGPNTYWASGHAPAVHFINRDLTEKYILGINSQDTTGGLRCRVWDALGVTAGNVDEKNVQISRSAFNYLDSTAAADYRFQTIGDVTFIINRTKVPAMKAKVTDTQTPQALLFVRQTLASSTDEKVVISWDGNKTGEINDDVASTKTLAANIYAELRGDDINEGTVTFDTAFNRVLQSSHDLVVGDAIRFTNSGTGWAKYEVRGSALYSRTSYEIDPEARYHVVAKTAGSFQIATEPGGPPLNFVESGSNHTVFAIGTDGPPTGFEKCVATIDGNLIHISHQDGDDFELTVTDISGDNLVSVYKESSQTFSELPEKAVDGFKLRVAGDPEQGLDDYYVRFNAHADPGRISDGVWMEVAGSDIPYQVDETTMPHLLVRKSDGTFRCQEAGRVSYEITSADDGNDRLTVKTGPGGTSNAILIEDADLVGFEGMDTASIGLGEESIWYAKVISSAADEQVIELYEEEGLSTKVTFDVLATVASYGYVYTADAAYETFTWQDRQCGDELVTPDPSFIGKKISDVAYYKNRLAFIAGENAILSESGEFFNFFRTTAAALLDTAPIDVASSHKAVSVLRTAIPYEGTLIIMGDRVQFSLSAPPGLSFTAKTAEIRVASNLEILDTPPLTSGNSVFFPFSRGDYTGFYEYVHDPNVEGQFEHYEITEQIPQYISGNVTDVAVLPRENLVLALAADTDTLYCYKHYKSGNQRLQSAWSKFTFEGADIRGIGFYDNDLHMVVRRGTNWFIEQVKFKTGRVDSGSTYVTNLDRRIQYVVQESDFNDVANTTTIDVPYNIEDGDSMEAISTDGLRATVTAVTGSGDTITLSGDKRGQTLWLGLKYTMLFEFSTQHMMEQSGQSQNIISQGRYQLRYGTILHDETGYYSVKVIPSITSLKNTYEYPMTGRVLGTIEIGEIPIVTGELRYPIHEKNNEVIIQILNDSPLPSNLMGAEFEATYYIRSVRAS